MLLGEKVAEVEALRANGGDRRSEKFQFDNCQTEKTQGGNSSHYLSRSSSGIIPGTCAGSLPPCRYMHDVSKVSRFLHPLPWSRTPIRRSFSGGNCIVRNNMLCLPCVRGEACFKAPIGALKVSSPPRAWRSSFQRVLKFKHPLVSPRAWRSNHTRVVRGGRGEGKQDWFWCGGEVFSLQGENATARDAQHPSRLRHCSRPLGRARGREACIVRYTLSLPEQLLTLLTIVSMACSQGNSDGWRGERSPRDAHTA